MESNYCKLGVLGLVLVAMSVGRELRGDEAVERILLASDPVKLVEDARKSGNAARGAIVFHSAAIGCWQCHSVEDRQEKSAGPNLAKWTRTVSDLHLVESLLTPSKSIAEGYQATKFLTDDQRVVTGIITSEDATTVRIATGPNVTETLAVADIDERSVSNVSLMPAGQMQQLASVNDFYDLVAYLIAIRDGGTARAAELKPSAESTKLRLPEYESIVDHAGMIADLDEASFERGAEIYRGLCINCHGTLEAAGSLPTALRFGEGKFKRGSDPFSMYHTLTHGSGLMLPQVWMVPQQKYDVIHYIREHFLREHNKSQWSEIDPAYLTGLPKGSTRGPAPIKLEPWATMDYGSMMTTTVEFGNSGENIAQKAICVRVDPGVGGVASGEAWVAFEHDTLRLAGAWSGKGFIDWNGIQFNGAHGIHPRVVGNVSCSNPTAPGWARPGTEDFEDSQRVVGRDKKRYGPLPASWGKFLGQYRSGDNVLLHYRVGSTEVWESPTWTRLSSPNDEVGQPDSIELFGRNLEVEARPQSLTMLVHTEPDADWELIESEGICMLKGSDAKPRFLACTSPLPSGSRWSKQANKLCLTLPAGNAPVRFSLAFGKPDSVRDEPSLARTMASVAADWSKLDLAVMRTPATATWGDQVLATNVATWFSDAAWSVDDIQLPTFNPWRARIRVTGIDFAPEQDAVVICTWDGDVWKGTGVAAANAAGQSIQWRRIAAGLFQPLGIIVDGDAIMLTCRDQLTRLFDLNGDGEMDHYECFNSDHQVTEHFHEFAMGLQRDEAGNWYYAKSARHALRAVVPHHGTLLKVDPQGKSTEIIATGFRAANGVCLNPDGTFIVTDQEGHWNPKNRINWVTPGGFYGNMFGYHNVRDKSDEAMEQPLCWITNAFDRSPAELLWVPKDRMGPLAGSLLNLSYGYGRIYVVPFEDKDGIKQGGMCALPFPDLPTGIIRGRFSPVDGHLYVGGMFAWASSRQDQEGGLYRVRYLGGPVDMPVGLRAFPDRIEIDFSDELDLEANRDIDRYKVRVWGLLRSENYGSEHIDERELKVTKAEVVNGKTLKLVIDGLIETKGMSIQTSIKTRDGREVQREIQNTINELGGNER